MLETLRSKKVLAAVAVVAAIVLLIVFSTSSDGKNEAPTAKASANTTSGAAPLNVTFSSDGSSDPDKDTLSFAWNFGDGTTSTQENPNKRFDKAGEYKVVLKVNDGHDHTVSASPITIKVGENVQGASTETETETTGRTLGTSTRTPSVRLAAVITPSNPAPATPTQPTTPSEPTSTPNPNLIPNPSFTEQYELDTDIPLHWIKGSYGENLAEFLYETNGRTDSSSVSITMSEYVYGDAKWIFEAVEITGGKIYTFSDWYKATTETELLVDWTLDDGTHQYDLLAPVAAAGDWTKLSRTLTAPANAVKISVHHMIKANGTLQVDDYSLVVE